MQEHHLIESMHEIDHTHAVEVPWGVQVLLAQNSETIDGKFVAPFIAF